MRWKDQTSTITVPNNSKAFLDITHSTLRCKLRVEGGSFSKVPWQLFAKRQSENSAAKQRLSEPAKRGRTSGNMLDHSPPTQLCIMNSPTKDSDFDEGKAIEDGFADEQPVGMVVHSADKVATTDSG